MSEYIFDVVNQTSKLDWAFAFQRTGSFPLDRSSLFSSLSDAEAYARGDKTDSRELGGSSYVGQPISIYDERNNSVSLYIIDTDRSLKEVGSAPLVDNNSIEIINNVVQLKDFGTKYYAFIPAVKNEETGEVITPSTYVLTDGFKEGLEPRVRLENEKYSIAWYEPSDETVEDIFSALENINSEINNLETSIINLETNVGQPSNEENNNIATGLYAKLEQKANKSDVYTKKETDDAIAAEIAKVDHLKRTTVAGVESIDLTAEDAEQYIYMVPNVETGSYDEYMVINQELEKVGDWSVDLSDYATTQYVNDELAKKVDAEEGSRLITEDEIIKLNNISEEAEKNYINSVDTEFNVSNGNLSLIEIAQTKVKGLIDSLNQITLALETKVNSEEGSRLITSNEITKLEAIKDLIQNIDTSKFTIDENGKLLLNSIEIEEISGLVEALANKVDKVEGSRLITSAEAAKLEALVLENGEITVSGTVNAANVKELYDVVYRIVTGTGTSIFDEVERPLLGIESEAEKNYINSVDETQLTVENRNLKIKAIEMDIVTGLTTALNDKATTSHVTDIERLLNNKVASYDARIAALEGQLTWQPLING